MRVNDRIKAILWDFGGVFTTSPFEAFARFEQEHGLPDHFIRTVNSTNSDTNAWAQFESSKISVEAFDSLFEQESASFGFPVKGTAVLQLLSGEVRPRMVNALRACKDHFSVGCITNNMKSSEQESDNAVTGVTETQRILELFDIVVESRLEGVRKPNPRIYEIACERLQCSPNECVFLDDLGINLKPARAMGMTTIKVVDPDIALNELEKATGLNFD